MKQSEIKVGEKYRAKVNNKIVTVEVLEIGKREGFKSYVSNYQRKGGTYFVCRNLTTGREVTFQSAMKFRSHEVS